MSGGLRLQTESDSESEVESGEERQDDAGDSQSRTEPTSRNPFNPTALEKRQRGNVWKSVVLEEDLASSLSKVSTRTEEDGDKPRNFVDLDSPSTSADAFPSPHASAISGLRGSAAKMDGPGRGSWRTHNKAPLLASSTSDGVAESLTNSQVFQSPQTGEKRKNKLKPKPKRTMSAKMGDKTAFFSVYPDLTEEILDTDRVDIAARKAVAQLKEKWNPWTITKIVSHLGNAEARKLLQLTKTIEQSGGMLTKDNQTRRTPGGVFIQLFKADAEPKIGAEALKKILAPAPGSVLDVQRAAKKKHAVERRAQKRAAAEAEAEATAATLPADMQADVQVSTVATQLPKVETPSVEESTESPSLMDVEVGIAQV